MNDLEQFLVDHGVPVGNQPETARTETGIAPISISVLQAIATDQDPTLAPAAAFAVAIRSAPVDRQLDRYRIRYERGMERHGVMPYPGNPAAIAAFLENLRYRTAANTRRIYVQAISIAHRDRGLEDPTLHEIVEKKLASLDRMSLERNLQIRPVLVREYLKLRASIPRDLRGLRDRSAIGIGFEGFLTCGLVISIDVECVQINDSGAVITLDNRRRRSVFIPRRGAADAVTDIVDYLAAAGLRNGPLFRAIDMTGHIGKPRMTMQALNKTVFQKRMNFAGFEARNYRFASLRAGHLVSAQLKGVDELQVAALAGIRTGSTLRLWRQRARTYAVLES